VFGSFCAVLSVFGLITSAAVFEPYFSENQLKGYDPLTIGCVFSVYLFNVFFAGMQSRPIVDRHGPRALVPVGSLLTTTSQMLLGLCTSSNNVAIGPEMLQCTGLFPMLASVVARTC
jgi:MFS family permease